MRIFAPTFRNSAALSGLLFGGLVIAGCGAGPGESESKMTSYTANESSSESAELFTVPQEQMAHVQVVPVEKTRLQRVLRLTGAVAYNQFKTTPVFPAIGGPVHELLVAAGETVHAGEPMLTVNSPDYSLARSSYIKARAAFQLAEKSFHRAEDLYAHGAISESDLQQAESNHTQAEADLISSQGALHALGIKDPNTILDNASKTTREIPLLAPVSGEVVERLVGPGQLLQNGAMDSVLVFTRTKHGADRVVKHLEREGISAVAMHADKT
ncbi:MAG: efflux RND transporter periplasmic adaptor subunit, partial [Terriglobales bacterium]